MALVILTWKNKASSAQFTSSNVALTAPIAFYHGGTQSFFSPSFSTLAPISFTEDAHITLLDNNISRTAPILFEGNDIDAFVSPLIDTLAPINFSY